MASLTRILTLGALLFAAGCPSDPGAILCPTGILCPADKQCGAVEAVCLENGCGNGFRDGVEECDDGNITEGDGCSTICRTEACGNNVVDPGEECDGGAGARPPGVPADAACGAPTTGLSACRWMYCGSGTIDPDEKCDDMNLMNGDGCTGTPVTVGEKTSPGPCLSREVCGNGFVDFQVGEVCDDSNVISGDNCSADCRSGEGCGNGFVDPGEQCDDGDLDNNDTCLNNCKFSVCGDGVVDATDETCDAGTTGTPVETATCNIDCSTRSCGDGKVNQTAGEQCDSGVGMNGDTRNCTGVCLLNICGDGKVDSQLPGTEACDDGNLVNTDGCSNACALASCGNSTVDTGEQCDDGNVDDTDACVACANAVCGDGKLRAGVEICDDGNVMNADGCSNTCRPEGCGNGILDPNEQCDDGNAVSTDACVTGCRIAVCGDTFIRSGVEMCDDGNVMNGDMCSSQCRLEGCGNGTLDPGEACDDGNMMSGDGCSFPNCTFESCGDGFVNNGEQCDGNGAGAGGETATCNVDCTTRACGDAKVNASANEQCDAGTILGVNQNADNRDCTAVCRLNICTDGKLNTIGPLNVETCDDGNTVNNDGCSNTCSLASCGNGLLDPMEDCDDLNALNTDACVGCKNARCGDGFVEMDVEECDGAPVGGDQCSLPGGATPGCMRIRCGNGIREGSEQCDNDVVAFAGIPASNDGCGSTCLIEICGDGVVNGDGAGASPAEACDPGPLAGNPGLAGESAGCDRNCTSVTCGDLTVNFTAGERCDNDLGAVGGDGCSSSCQLERCGNNVVDPFEECDAGLGGSPTCYGANDPMNRGCLAISCGNSRIDVGETCEPPGTPSCTAGPLPTGCQKILFCGDNIVSMPNSAAFMEQCEPPGTATCNHDCTASSCGDGKVNPQTTPTAETCDTSGQSATCDTNCTAAVCGDGTTNASASEACDDGVNNAYTKDCLPTCIKNTCGDGYVNTTTNPMTMMPFETCDEGSSRNGTACPYQTSCMRCNMTCSGVIADPNGPRCGDSTVQMAFNEECDPPVAATTSAAGCNASCKITPELAECGNGLLESGEMCDEATDNGQMVCLDGTAQASLPYNGSCVRCSGSCMVLPLMGAYCGDGAKNGVELCDGADIGAQTCVGAGFTNPGMGMGAPACATGCFGFTQGTCGP